MSHACTCGLHTNAQRRKSPRPRRFDPSRTTGLRNAFVRGMTRRFTDVRAAIRKKLLADNFFSYRKVELAVLAEAPVGYRFQYDTGKLNDFDAWLQAELKKNGLLSAEGGAGLATGQGQWADGYVDSAYRQGIKRGSQELKAQGVEGVIDIDMTVDGGLGYSFVAPVTKDDLAGLKLRTYESLKGVSKEMAAKIGSALAAGFADGLDPWTIAKTIAATTGMSLNRARTIARTEIIRAHHRGLFRQYKASGVKGVKFRVEWLATPDDRVCPECASLSGKVFLLEEMEYAIPKHPNCRCVMIPYTKDLEEGYGEEEAPEETVAETTKAPGVAAKVAQVPKETKKRVTAKDLLTPSVKGNPTDARRFDDELEMLKLLTAREKKELLALKRALGDKLVLEDIGQGTTITSLQDMAKIPPGIRKKLAADKRFGGIHMDDKLITTVPEMQMYKGVRPRGWPEGSTWDDVAGAYSQSSTKKVLLAKDRRGFGTSSPSMALHETGHAVGDVLGYNSATETGRHHKRLFYKLTQYEQQGGIGGMAGMEEMFAEGVATLLKEGRAAAVVRYDEDFVVWLEGILK